MGNCDSDGTIIERNEKEAQEKKKLSDFTKLYPIGKSGFSTIWKVQLIEKEKNQINNNNNKNIFAMKIINKAKIFIKKLVNDIETNRRLMEKLNHKLLCKMYYAFQDMENLYFVVEYFSGGDLRYLINRRNNFEEKETKFIISCIALIINYLHENNVIYRDIKPEKFLFGKDGYLYLTDLILAKECKKEETVISPSGTPGYMAPEAIINQPHNFSVDYFALGVILYELSMGERPYQGNNRKEIKDEMFKFEINLNKDDIPSDWDINVADLINGLLKRKKKYRLGSKGFDEVKNHPWFNDIQWEKIENCEFISPFKIEEGDHFDKEYVEIEDDDSIYEGNKQLYIDKINESLVYKNFYFNYEDKNKNNENKDKENEK